MGSPAPMEATSTSKAVSAGLPQTDDASSSSEKRKPSALQAANTRTKRMRAGQKDFGPVVGCSGQSRWPSGRASRQGAPLSSAHGQGPAPHGSKFLHWKLNPGNLTKRRTTAGPHPGATPSELEGPGPRCGFCEQPRCEP